MPRRYLEDRDERRVRYPEFPQRKLQGNSHRDPSTLLGMTVYSIQSAQTDLFGASTKVLTLAELTRAIRGTLETKFGAVWVQGEISNCKQHPSGLCHSERSQGCNAADVVSEARPSISNFSRWRENTTFGSIS
jgi:OB-fold nucleic acid binding domain